MIDIEQLENVDWGILVERQHNPLMTSTMLESTRVFGETIGRTWPVTRAVWFENATLLMDKGQKAEERKLLDDEDFIRHVAEVMVERGEQLLAIAERIAQVDLEKASGEEVQNMIEEYYVARLASQSFLAPVVPIDGILARRIKANLQDEELLSVLTYPEKLSWHTQEIRDFLSLAAQRGDADFDDKLTKHIEEYSWIHARSWINRKLTKEELIKRIEGVENPEEKLAELDEVYRTSKEQQQKLLADPQIQKMADLVALAREYVYLRTWRADVLYKSMYRIRSLFFLIGAKAGFSPADTMYLTQYELRAISAGKSGPSQEEIERRKEGVTLLIFDGEFALFSGKEWQEKLAALAPKVERKTELKGVSAFPGKVRGRAQLILSHDDVIKVETDDILVATMTEPSQITAMERAAAFVTNEGGILCHAAILAREMKKPCVIATRDATKVFKNGDTLEVDADNGVVRKV